MAEQIKLAAFAVALTFEGGTVTIHTLVAPNAESATAMAGVAAARQHEGNLAGMAVVELTAEWLRFALRSMESGKASGDVVSLVSDNLRPATPSQRVEGISIVPDNGSGRTLRCDKHKTVFRPGEACGSCVDDQVDAARSAQPAALEHPSHEQARQTEPNRGNLLTGAPLRALTDTEIAGAFTPPNGPYRETGCFLHPDIPRLNGRCPLCQPTTGGAA